MTKKLTGLIAAPFTPMHDDGRLNLDAVEPYVRLLADDGVAGAFICGTTGEGASLTTAERKAVAQRWRDAIRDAGAPLKLIVHVGHTAQGEAIELARHAADLGVDAVAAIAPYYARPATAADLIAFLEPIGAASDLPLYYYHMPSVTGVNLRMRTLLAEAGDRLPTLAGVKFTYEDLRDFSLCAALDGGRFNMLFGRDEALLAGLVMGADGAVGSTYNFAAPLYLPLIEALKRGDLAEALDHQRRAQWMIDDVFGQGLGPAKAAMACRGVDCGPPRPPLQAATPEQARTIREALWKHDLIAS